MKYKLNALYTNEKGNLKLIRRRIINKTCLFQTCCVALEFGLMANHQFDSNKILNKKFKNPVH